ncbi:MAG: hypothetical protein ACRELB_17315 [Polyangiaceae bacterium]
MVHQIPLSIVILSIALPIALSTRPRPTHSLRVLYFSVALLALVWCMLCLHVYPVYVVPE